MKNQQNDVFLNKISSKIKNGEFDEFLTVPFMSKELLFASIKARIDKKIENGATPVLNDTEVKDAIKDAKETAGYTMAMFIKPLNIFVKGVDGWELSDVAKKALNLNL